MDERVVGQKNLTLLAWKMEKGDHKTRKWTVSRTWERKGNAFTPQSLLKGTQL